MFTVPAPFTNETPFAQMHVWQWALHQKRDRVEIGNYLAEVGFVVGRDKLSEADYDTCDLFRPLNSRDPWPLYMTTPEGEELQVFDGDGSLSDEMLCFLKG